MKGFASALIALAAFILLHCCAESIAVDSVDRPKDRRERLK